MNDTIYKINIISDHLVEYKVKIDKLALLFKEFRINNDQIYDDINGNNFVIYIRERFKPTQKITLPWPDTFERNIKGRIDILKDTIDMTEEFVTEENESKNNDIITF